MYLVVNVLPALICAQMLAFRHRLHLTPISYSKSGFAACRVANFGDERRHFEMGRRTAGNKGSGEQLHAIVKQRVRAAPKSSDRRRFSWGAQ
jgi:hypothetical protein